MATGKRHSLLSSLSVLIITLAASYSSSNYLNASAKDYPFYMRKHNPLEIYDSVSQNVTRQGRIRNFNDFANDLVNGSLSQWIFVTPNMVGPFPHRAFFSS